MEKFNDTVNELLGTVLPTPSTAEILISLASALLLCAVLWLTYRFANTAASYEPKFAATLISLALITTILMDLIQSNLALSLGMLGSLSIVRFRTNIRDPRDIGFIFWSMAIGLSASTGHYFIGLTGSLILSVCLLASRKNSTALEDMLLVIRGSNTDISSIHSIVKEDCAKSTVKAKNILSDSYELVYQVRIPVEESDSMIQGLFHLAGVDSVNLLASQKMS